MPARILIADSVAADCDRALESAGLEVHRDETVTTDTLAGVIVPYHGVIVRSRIKVLRPAIEAAPNLRIIGRAGTGTDNIDCAAARERGVEVVNAPAANAQSVAEHAIALLFAVRRRVAEACAVMRAGRWDRGRFMGRELAGSTLGIIGVGRIGCTVANLARGLGMRVIANSPSATNDAARAAGLQALGIELVDYLALLRDADAITLHVPLKEDTRCLVGAAELKRMKRDAVLINTSRGGIVDESALARALRDGTIAGAAVDVYEEEPPPADHPLRSLPNCVCTPHLAASTEEAQTRAAVDIARAFATFFSSR